ncbi:MAG: condensation domain-containing protein, partial [Acidobacteriota bacterium]
MNDDFPDSNALLDGEADSSVPDGSGLEIAVIGMAGRFPGAADIDQLWRNLREGIESIDRFSPEELRASGVPSAEHEDSHYVPARAVLAGAERFDAAFFDVNPREAEILDPQHRLFLECAWQAVEDAGYDTVRYGGRIGVFAGVSMSSYLLFNLMPRTDLMASLGSFQTMLANDKDYLPTRVSYKLNLTGPSVLVQTACSTSLVAVHLACQSLLNGESDMALAGGVSITFPQRRGYRHKDGAIFSPDGHCRPFDHRAQGTVNGDGVGVVLLKRLEDAIADGDPIDAVIKGSAINNDGAQKAGYTAPSVEGQAAVISAAQLMAEVEAESIGYVEAHGTATHLGDPIEMTALTEAFGATTERRGFCAIGSVKSNFGHLDAAAGIAGLIKTVLVLKHREIPPSLHFEQPNPEIDFDNSPFFVNQELRPWPSDATSQLAAVSSFGIGGTNAHAILAPASSAPAVSGPSSRPCQLLVLSARSATALEQAAQRLADHLAPHPESVAQDGVLPDGALADVAYTLATGRRAFEHRRMLTCSDVNDAITRLRQEDPAQRLVGLHEGPERPVCFLFSGQGSQYPGMGRELYDSEPTFRQWLDRCLELLRPHLAEDPREILFPAVANDAAAARLRRTENAQPLLFSLELSLARLWLSWGVEPAAMLGHSLGEYVAATLAEVFSLEDAIALVAARGKIMQSLPEGQMLSVAESAERLRPRLGDALDLAVINAPGLCVVAGEHPAVKALAEELTAAGVENRPLHTSHAFHSAMMESAIEPLRAVLTGLELKPPTRRFLSNLSGDWITPEQATDPEYWLRHLRQPVDFAAGLATLLQEPNSILLEVGPGRALASLVAQQGEGAASTTLTSLPHARDAQQAGDFTHRMLGRLWLAGGTVDWDGVYRHEDRRRLRLPTYPFESRPYWIAPRVGEDGAPDVAPVAAADVGPEGAAAAAATSDEPAKHQRPNLATPFVAPSNKLEEGLVAVWEELLGVAGIGLHDDFFDLGGHSLLATQVLSRVREKLGVEVPLRQLMDGPTIAQLAAQVDATGDVVDARPSLPDLVAVSSPDGVPAEDAPPDDAPLSFSQERLWFLDQLEPGSPAYNLSFALSLRGTLDVAVLERSFDEIQRRHEALRTDFTLIDERPVQRVLPHTGLSLGLVDLSGLAPERREAERDRWIVEDALQPFQLTAGPLFRTHLLRLAETEHLLLVTFHHVISDAWSFGIIASELADLYRAFLRRQPSPLAELEIQYVDFARWQRDWLRGEVLESQVSYWRRRLAQPPSELRLPADFPMPEVPSHRGAMHPLVLSETLTAATVDLGQRRRTTLYMTLSAVFAALLHFYSRAEDILVGSPIAGRSHRQTEPLIGFFINTLVIRHDLGGDPTFEELLERTRQTTLEAYAHQDLPFEKLVSALQLERDLHRTPLFRVWFVLQTAPAEALDLPG